MKNVPLHEHGRAGNRRRGLRNAQAYRWVVQSLYESGLSLHAIARALDERRIRTPEDGARWYAATVKRIVDRLQLSRAAA